jgi:hypothetical protein
VASGADDPAFVGLRIPFLTVKALGIITVVIPLPSLLKCLAGSADLLFFPHLIVVFFESSSSSYGP